MGRSNTSDSWSLSHLGYLYPGTTPVMIKLDHKLELSLGINSPVDEGSNYHNKGPREGTHLS